MFKDGRYINAGQNEFYRWGRKAIEKVTDCMQPHSGYYSIPTDGGRYWTFGTSEGKFGEFARVGETCFSVNKAGFMYAKDGTEKGERFLEALKDLIIEMENKNKERMVEEDD